MKKFKEFVLENAAYDEFLKSDARKYQLEVLEDFMKIVNKITHSHYAVTNCLTNANKPKLELKVDNNMLRDSEIIRAFNDYNRKNGNILDYESRSDRHFTGKAFFVKDK